MNGHELETNWLICDVLHFDIRQHGLSYGQFRRSFWVVGLRRSAICVNCVLEALLLLLTYLLTYLLSLDAMDFGKKNLWKTFALKSHIKFLIEIYLRTTGCRLAYGLTQCYLPPDTSEHTPP